MTLQDLAEARAHPNVRAFLRAIRLGEGTSDDQGYHRLVMGGHFELLDRHPRVTVPVPLYKDAEGKPIRSSAAGAYQIIKRTWDGLVAQYAFPDFSERSQDLAAIALIAEKQALEDVIYGRIETAIRKCGAIWASLPSSTAGQRRESLQAVLATYRQWGGHLA